MTARGVIAAAAAVTALATAPASAAPPDPVVCRIEPLDRIFVCDKPSSGAPDVAPAAEPAGSEETAAPAPEAPEAPQKASPAARTVAVAAPDPVLKAPPKGR